MRNAITKYFNNNKKDIVLGATGAAWMVLTVAGYALFAQNIGPALLPDAPDETLAYGAAGLLAIGWGTVCGTHHHRKIMQRLGL